MLRRNSKSSYQKKSVKPLQVRPLKFTKWGIFGVFCHFGYFLRVLGSCVLLNIPEDQPLLGDASVGFKVFLPKEKCQATTDKAFEKLSGIFWGVFFAILATFWLLWRLSFD